MTRSILLLTTLLLTVSLSLSQTSYPKPIVFEGDTLYGFTAKQVKQVGKYILRVQELTKQDSAKNVEIGIHKNRIHQLEGTVDTVQKEVYVQRELSARKDSVILNYQNIVIDQQRFIKQQRRRGKVRSALFGIGGFSIGVGVGILIGVLR